MESTIILFLQADIHKFLTIKFCTKRQNLLGVKDVTETKVRIVQCKLPMNEMKMTGGTNNKLGTGNIN